MKNAGLESGIFRSAMKWESFLEMTVPHLPLFKVPISSGKKGIPALVGSGSVFQSMNSSVTMNLSVIFHLRGVNFTLSGACASGSHAIGMGYHLIRHGYQDHMICGGSQEVNLFCVGSFDALGAFSKHGIKSLQLLQSHSTKDRDGLVPSGGAPQSFLKVLIMPSNEVHPFWPKLSDMDFLPMENIFPFPMLMVLSGRYPWQ